MRWTLALRGVLTVMPLAAAGLLLFREPVWTGMACLTALLMVIADFRGTRQHVAYALTAIGCLLASAIGGAPTPVWATVLIVGAFGALLAGLRGFSGFLAAAGVTVTAELLISVGLRAAGADWLELVTGAAAGAALAIAVGRVLPGGPQELDRQAALLTMRCAAVLNGEAESSTLVGSSRDLMRVYIESKDRPQAPTRTASAQIGALNALARCADLLANGTTVDDPQLRAASRDTLTACANADLDTLAERLRDSEERPHLQSRELLVEIESLAEFTRCAANGRTDWAEWREQIRVRIQPDGVLLTQAAISGVLYAVLTWLVLTVAPPHPQWILLGAVTATYPYARRSAVVLRNLLLGTAGGFVILLGVLPLTRLHPGLWWLVLLSATVLAVGAPHGQRGWIIGQSAFTTLSLTLLALSAGGLPVAAIGERLENILIGAGSAVAVAALLAPRTMRAHYQSSLAGLLDVTAHGMAHDEVNDRQIRAAFLKCTDVIEVIRGTGYVPLPDLVDWLDAARLAVTLNVQAAVASTGEGGEDPIDMAAHQVRERAIRLRANQEVTTAPRLDGELGALLGETLAAQAEDLRRLSPRLPRAAFT